MLVLLALSPPGAPHAHLLRLDDEALGLDHVEEELPDEIGVAGVHHLEACPETARDRTSERLDKAATSPWHVSCSVSTRDSDRPVSHPHKDIAASASRGDRRGSSAIAPAFCRQLVHRGFIPA